MECCVGVSTEIVLQIDNEKQTNKKKTKKTDVSDCDALSRAITYCIGNLSDVYPQTPSQILVNYFYPSPYPSSQ